MAILSSLGAGATVAITINAVDKFSRTFSAASLGIKAVGAAMKVAAIAIAATAAALVTIGTVSLKTAAEFETAFTGVRKTVDLTEKGFADLEERFKEMSKTAPIAFTELARIGELAGQLGVSGVDNIEKFTKTVADISVTTNLTAEQAATDFARFANIMNMPIDQIDRLGSVVVELGNNLATTEAEIVEMGLRISGAGKALDLSEGQVLAWGAALSSVGIQAQMGGSAISKLMINIASMVAKNSITFEEFAKTSDKIGDELAAEFSLINKDLTKFAEVAGMTADEFSKAFEVDASAALQTFFNGLGKIKEEGGNVLAVLESLDIKEVRLRDAVLRLSSSYVVLNEALDLQGDAWNENTALVEEAQKRYDTFDSKVQVLKNTFDVFKAEMGAEFMPVMKDLVVVLTEKVLPALEPLISLLGEVFRKAIEALTPHLEGMTTRFVELAEIFFKDVLPVVLEVARTVGGFLVEKFKMFFEMIKPILPTLIDFAQLIFELGRNILRSLIPIIELFTKIIADNRENIRNLVQQVSDFIGQIISRLVPVLERLLPVLFDVAFKLADIALEILDALLPALDVLIPIFLDLLEDVIIPLLPPIAELIKTAVILASRLIQALAPALRVIVSILKVLIIPIKFVIDLFTKLLNLINKFLGKSSQVSSSISSTNRATGTSSSTSSSGVIHLNPPSSRDVIRLNDFILSKGRIIQPSPQDTIIGTKNPGAIGGVTIVIEGDVNGTDPEQMAEAFGRELKRTIRI